MHRRLWEEHITYFIEVNKIQIYPIRSLIVTHYSVWSILHNYPQCWQTICSVKVNKLQIALWDTAQHLQILGLASIARHQCLEAKYVFSCEWIDVPQLKFLENYTPNNLNTFWMDICTSIHYMQANYSKVLWINAMQEIQIDL